jgi:hypothetical protein
MLYYGASSEGEIMWRRSNFAVVVASITAALSLATVVPSSATVTNWPSGQRMIGNTTFNGTIFTGGGGVIEPAIDDANGSLTYLLTPNNSTTMPNAHNVAPLYLPVYPAGSGIDPAILNCSHVPADNCADHGPVVAGGAMGIEESKFLDVYDGGVLGHDHLVGLAKTHGDFNVIWEPILVLFTNARAAETRLLTIGDINAAVNSGNAYEVPLPQLDFHCSAVSAALYNHATPGPTVP